MPSVALILSLFNVWGERFLRHHIAGVVEIYELSASQGSMMRYHVSTCSTPGGRGNVP